jgi:glycosyltransferase involved in cell wall biosynthesis
LATPQYIRDTPLLAVHHHVHGRSLFSELPYPAALYVYHMERYLLRHYTRTPLITVSESNRDELKSLYDFQQVEVLHNGIDAGFLSGVEVGRDAEPTLVYLGRLKRYKRVDHLLRALVRVRERVPRARMLIAGRGDDEPRLQALAAELGLQDAVTFLGFVDETGKAEVLLRGWVQAAASEKEGWGITLVEGNAAGLPAVAYDVEGVRNAVQHEQTGLLVPDGDQDALTARITELLTDEAKRVRLSEQARAWAARFSWEQTAAAFHRKAEHVVETFTPTGVDGAGRGRQ